MTHDPSLVSPAADVQSEVARDPAGHLGRLRRWLRTARRRRGSVLILVVALLVLLALIGTAFITTAGADRDSAVQHGYNTEIDLLVEGTKNLVLRQLIGKVITPNPPYDYLTTPTKPPGRPSFHTAMTRTQQTAREGVASNYAKPWLEYSNVDFAPWDTVLADRYPQRPPGATAGQPEWRYITASPLAQTRDQNNPTLLYNDEPPQPAYPKHSISTGQVLFNNRFPQFASPFVGKDLNGLNVVGTYATRARLAPGAIRVGVNGVTRFYPAFQINDPTDANAGRVVLAADADGDGIADAGLFELNVGRINGLRYFAGFRVVDNAAAVNVSTAWQPADPNTDAALPISAFPSNIDFRGFVEGYATSGPEAGPDPKAPISYFDKINFKRFNNVTTVGLGGAALNYPTQTAAFWAELGSRLENPGVNSAAGRPFIGLGAGESASLARRFCLSDPTGGGGGVVESSLPSFRWPKVARQPFLPNEITGSSTTWFDSIFDYENLNRGDVPLRPMLTGTNPVSNFTPGFIGDPRVPLTETEREGKYQYRGDWPESVKFDAGGTTIPNWISPTEPNGANEPYRVGDWVTYNGKAYICIRPHLWAALAANEKPIKNGDNQAYNVTSQPPVFSHTSDKDRPTVGTPDLTGAPPSGTPNLLYWAEAPWSTQVVKTNINTASFGQLYAAFMAVMGDAPLAYPGGLTPMTSPEVSTTYGTVSNTYWSFGNVTRPVKNGATPGETTVVIPSESVRQLRAALAAVNAIDLRDQDEDVTSRTVALTDASGGVQYKANVYGSERQPYITESIVHIPLDISKTYVAIELYNPSPIPLKLDAFRLYWRGRDSADAATAALTLIHDFHAASPVPVIPGFGYIYLESNTANRPEDMDATVNAPVPAGGDDKDVFAGKTVYQQPLLTKLVEGGGTRELYMLRTRRFDGTPTKNDVGLTDSPNQFDETTRPDDLVPIDQSEFVGLISQTIQDPAAPLNRVPVPVRYHYRRATAYAGGSYSNRWHCVYSGPYDRSDVATAGERHQRGWIRDPLPTDPTELDIRKMQFSLPGWGDKTEALTAEVWPHNLTAKLSDPARATYRTRTLQIASFGMPGPWKPRMPNGAGGETGAEGEYIPSGVGLSMYPVGGFVRAGDVMQVPFCGAYKIYNGSIPVNLPELNSVGLDAVFADDGDKVDDDEASGVGGNPVEQLGRFCPIYKPGTINDIALPATGSQRVAWARDLFEYFTTISPQDDYTPNVDPDQYLYHSTPSDTNSALAKRSGDPTLPGSAPKWGPQTTAPKFGETWTDPTSGTIYGTPVNPPAVPNGLSKVSGRGLEDNVGIQGLINVNTANWKVIATLPFTNNHTTNETLAKAIVNYRDDPANGRPFRNLFELMLVPGLADAMGATANLNPQPIDGDVTPLPAEATAITTAPGGISTDDGVKGDFEARYLVINRISNLVSFRTDSFTVYVVVQGWRNAGTANAELVTQRRAAMIVDRSAARVLLPTLKWTKPPADPEDYTTAPDLIHWEGVTVTNPTTTNVPQN